jgi:hypothetical protein
MQISTTVWAMAKIAEAGRMPGRLVSAEDVQLFWVVDVS